MGTHPLAARNPPMAQRSIALLAALLPLAGGQPTPIPIARPEQVSYGQYTRAFQSTKAVARFGHVATATGSPTGLLVLAGGQGSIEKLPTEALPTSYMGADSVDVSIGPQPPAATGLDQLAMSLSFGAHDTVYADWNTRAQTGYELVFGGPDFYDGYMASAWLNRLDFSTATVPGTYPNWTWVQSFDPASTATPLARTNAAAAFLDTCFSSDTTAAGWCFIVFGGTDKDGNPLGSADVLRIPHAGSTYPPGPLPLWTRPGSITAQPLVPAPRYDHSLTAHYDGASAFMFGGVASLTAADGSACSQQATNELWQLAPAGFPDSTPEEMINIINSPYAGVTVTPTAKSVPGLDPLLSSTSGFAALFDNVALDGVANTANDAQEALVEGFNRCIFTAGLVTQPYIQIDLGANDVFAAVSLFVQTDCYRYPLLADQEQCMNRMQDVDVFAGKQVGSTSTPWDAAATKMCSDPGPIVGVRADVLCPDAAVSGARYIWIVLPGTQRSFGLCEVQVLRKQRWQWRKLAGGLVNVAAGKQAGQTSQATTLDGPFSQTAGNGNAALAFADATRALDGVLTNDARSQTCAITSCSGSPACEGVSPGSFQEWRVNLAMPQQVRTIKIWPAIFDGLIGPGHGGPEVIPKRLTRWFVTAGNSLRAELNTLCTGAPVDLTPANLAPDGSLTLNCPAIATFVQIRRYSGGADGLDGDDAVSVCEVQVWADEMANVPSPRAGHATAGFRGQIYVFGGYDASGLQLNDMNHYSMLGKRWTQTNPYGTPPEPRSYAQLTVLNSFRLALSHGMSGSDVPLTNVWSNLYAGCPGVISTGVQSSYCRQGGSACRYTCVGGYVNQNAAEYDGWLVCLPSGGLQGYNPPCAPQPAGAPGTPSATPTSPTTALVTWTAASPGGAASVQYYQANSRDSSGAAEWFDTFPDTTSVANTYVFWDPSANKTAGVLGGSSFGAPMNELRLTSAPNQNCIVRTRQDGSSCPYVMLPSTLWPASLPRNDFAVETIIVIEGRNLYQPVIMAGLGLVDESNGFVQVILGVEYVAPYYFVVWDGFKSGIGGNSLWRILQELRVSNVEDGLKVYLRIERSPRTGNNYRASYKLNALDSYIEFNRPATMPADFFGGPLQPSTYVPVATTMQPALIINNRQGTSPRAAGSDFFFTASFEYLYVGPTLCALQGMTAFTPDGTTLSATVRGLTPGAKYQFDVRASNDPFAQAWGSWGPTASTTTAITMPTVADVPFSPANYVEVAIKRPSHMYPSVVDPGRTGLVNDGVVSTTLMDSTGMQLMCASTPLITSAMAAADPDVLYRPLSWTVDLGSVTDVAWIYIATATDYTPRNLDGFAIYLTEKPSLTSTGAPNLNAAQSCVGANMPYSLVPSGSSTFRCDARGRFVTVAIPAAVGVQLTLCEVHVFANNACPPRNSSWATITSGTCIGAKRGDSCTQACLPGYTAVQGGLTASCQGATWSAPPLVCQPTCPPTGRPIDTTECLETILYEDFNDPPPYVMSKWAPADNRQAWGSSWFYDPDNYILEASTRKGCLSDMLLLSTRAVFANLQRAFTFETVVLGRDGAGLAFRVVDNRNYYRFVIDPREKKVELHLVRYGNQQILSSWPAPRLRPDVYYTLRMYVDGPRMIGTIARWDDFSRPIGSVVANITDNTLSTGGAGLFAETHASWQYAHIWSQCAPEASGCERSVHEDQCTLLCRAGMAQVGSSTLFCNAQFKDPINGTNMPRWEGTPPTCLVQQPTFRVFDIECPEFAPVDTQCGERLGAESFSIGDDITYAIVGGNSNNAFYIQSTTAALRVRNQSALSFDSQPGGIFALTVRAYAISGATPLSQIDVPINVFLRASEGAPQLPSPQVFNINEGATGGAFVGTLQQSLADIKAGYLSVIWTIDSVLEAARSTFTLDPTSGNLTVARRSPTQAPIVLDYETVPFYTIFGRAARAKNPAQLTQVTVVVNVVDVDSAPYVDPEAPPFKIAEAQFTPGTPASTTLGARILDSDTNPAWLPPVVTPTFTLVSPSTWSTLPVWSPCHPSKVPAALVPTVSGALGDTPLFSLGTSSGENSVITVAATPQPPLSVDVPVFQYGVLATAVYRVCVQSSDTLPGTPPTTLQLVTVAIEADLSSRKWIAGCTLPASYTANGGFNTSGGEVVTCTAGSSGAFALPTSGLRATYKTTVGQLVSFSVNCAVSSDGATVTCPVAAGVGYAMTWSFADPADGNRGIAIASALVTNYMQPIVSSAISFPTQPITNTPLAVGGDHLLLTGNNFGTGSGTGAPGTYSVSITFKHPPVFGALPAPENPYVCDYIPPGGASRSSDTAIECRMPAGAGSGLVVSVNVGGQSFQSLVPGPFGLLVPGPVPTLSYAAPVLTSIALYASVTGSLLGNNITNLSPGGGDTVSITGRNFGPGTHPSEYVAVSFGGTNGKLFDFRSCVRDAVNPDTLMRCVTPPGQGTNLRVVVNIAGTNSAVSSGLAASGLGISYVGPTILAITGPGVAAGSTAGGEDIIVTGINFPPVTVGSTPAQPIELTYGPGVDRRFTASRCVVTQAAPRTPTIRCSTAPGTGTMNSWQLSIAGAASPVFTGIGLSYQSPIVKAVSGGAASGGSTTGAPLVVTGQGFGPSDAYTNSKIAITYSYILPLTGVPSLSFNATRCRVSVPHTEITCATVPGVGSGLAVNAVINGLVSASITISYEVPTVTGVYLGSANPLAPASTLTPITGAVNLGDPNFQSTITVRGTGFGPPQITSFLYPSTTPVTFDPVCAGCITWGPSASERTVTSQTHDSNTQLRIVVGAGPGGSGSQYVKVRVGNQVTPVVIGAPNVTFHFAPPVAFEMTPNRSDTFSLDFDPTIINLRVTNVPFLDSSAELVVLFGNPPNQEIIVPSDLPTDITGLFNLLNYDGTYNVTFALPLYWSGAYMPVRLAQRRVSGVTTVMPVTPKTVFSYNGPQIDQVVVTRYTWNDADPSCVECGITGFPQDVANENFLGPNPRANCTPPGAGLQDIPASCPAKLCVFPQGGVVGAPAWNCSKANPTPIYKIVILGKNFRTSIRELFPVYNYMEDGVLPFVEIFNREINITGPAPPNGSAPKAYVGVWEPSTTLPVSLGGAVSPNPQNYVRACPYWPTFGCTFRASKNTFQYLSAWGNYRIEMYTTLGAGTVRVRLVSPGPTGTCVGGVGPGCIEQIDERTYNGLSPSIGSLTGDITQVPTYPLTVPGQYMLSILVGELDLATSVEVFVGDGNQMPRSRCPLVKTSATGVYQSMIANGTERAAIIDAQLATGLQPGNFWVITCLIPPGQGLQQPVQVFRVSPDGSRHGTDNNFHVSYAQPAIDRSEVIDVNGVTILATFYRDEILRAPTDGKSLIRVRGVNLGVSPNIYAGWNGVAGIKASDGKVLPCPASAPHTCYQFYVQAGEGGNVNPACSSLTPGCWQMQFGVGGQYAYQAFAYAAPTIQGVVVSGGTGPSATLVPTIGAPKMNATIIGKNFGQPIAAQPSVVSAGFGYIEDGALSMCSKVVRVNHTCIICVGLPAGGGASLPVWVSVGGQNTTATSTFSYMPPLITEAYAVWFATPGFDRPGTTVEPYTVDKDPPAGVTKDNYNQPPYSLATWPCDPANVTNFKPHNCSGLVTSTLEFTGNQLISENVCIGTGYDPKTNLVRTSNYRCPGSTADPVALNLTAISKDVRIKFSNFTYDFLQGTLVPTVTKALRNQTVTAASVVPPALKYTVVGITGGKANAQVVDAAGHPIVTQWSLIPPTATGLATLSSTPLTLKAPSRSVDALGRGSVVIMLKGSNFGPRDAGSCMALAWSYRYLGPPFKGPTDGNPACDGWETFLGEGEVATRQTFLWDDVTGQIGFIVGPGIGRKDVEIVNHRSTLARAFPSLAFNNADRIRFEYAAPEISDMTPNTVAQSNLECTSFGLVSTCNGLEADGSSRLRLEVMGLPYIAKPPSSSTGPPLTTIPDDDLYTSLSTCALPGLQCPSINGDANNFATRTTVSLAKAPQLTTAIVLVTLAHAQGVYAVLTDAHTITGQPHPALTQACLFYGIYTTAFSNYCVNKPFKRDVAFTMDIPAPVGVGPTVRARVETWDGGNGQPYVRIAQSAPYTAFTGVDAGLTVTRYHIPRINSIYPRELLMGDDQSGAPLSVVEFRGHNFGNYIAGDPLQGMCANGAYTCTTFNPARFEAYIGSSDNNGGWSTISQAFVCATSTRIETPGAPTYARCEVESRNAKCGLQRAILDVGGQLTPFNDTQVGSADFEIGCHPGYFCSLGQSCMACPVLGATCKGYQPFDARSPNVPAALRHRRPIAEAGFFDLNSSYCSEYMGVRTCGGFRAANGSGFIQYVRNGAGSLVARTAYGPVDARMPRCPYSVQIWDVVNEGGGAFTPGVTKLRNISFPSGPDSQPRDVCIMPCHNYWSCLGGNVCAEGYESVAPYFRCATCKTGYFMRFGRCVACPSGDGAVVFAYIVAIIVAVLLAWVFSKYEVHVAMLSIGVDFCQTVGMLAWTKVAWSPEVQNLFSVLSAAYLNVEITAPECLSGYETTSFSDKFFSVLWLPVSLFVLLLLTHLVIVAYQMIVNVRSVKKATNKSRPNKHLPQLVSCFVLVASVLYMYETMNLLQVFNCGPLHAVTYDSLYPGTYPVTGNRVAMDAAQAALAADGAWQTQHVLNYLYLVPEECSVNLANIFIAGRTPSTQEALFLYAVFFMAVGVAGWPIGIFAWLYRNRLIIMEDQLLRAKGQGADRLTGPNTYEFRKAFGRLYYQFKPEMWYWQVVIYLRKFTFLVIMLYTFNKNGAYQMVSAAIILLCFYVLHVRASPFMCPDEYESVLRDHKNKSVTSALHARLRAAIKDVESKGRRGPAKALVNFNGQINRAALLGAVATALFDYNTVEAVMLFTAIMTCLMGVMTEVHVALYNGEAQSASMAVQAIVILALLYFFFVATWDTILEAANRAKADKEAAAKRRKSKSLRGAAYVKEGAKGSLNDDEDGGSGAGSGRRRSSAFHRGAANLVNMFTSEEQRASSDAAVKAQLDEEAAMRGAAPGAEIQVATNPLMMRAASAKNLSGDGGSMPPPPPPGGMPLPPTGAATSAVAAARQRRQSGLGEGFTPGEMDALLQAADQFTAPGSAPPPELWSTFRDAFGDVLSQANDRDFAIATLKQQLDEARVAANAAIAEQERMMRMMPQHLGGGGGGAFGAVSDLGSSFYAAATGGYGAPPPPPPPPPPPGQPGQSLAGMQTFASATQRALKPTRQASAAQLATAAQKSLKPSKQGFSPTPQSI